MSAEKRIQKQFNKGCTQYTLLEDGDKILIGLSGGKDSLQLTRLMAQRSKIFKPRIEVEAVHVVMDNVPYSTDIAYLEQFCNEYGIKFNVVHTHFEEGAGNKEKSVCFLCSWHRRKAIFEYACANAFNKVALGHHQDDILTTLLMNMTFEGAFSTMPPIIRMEHYPISIIRPMCLVHEADIKTVAKELNFMEQTSKCPFENESKRKTMEDMFHTLEEINPEARYSLWNSMENIRTDNLPHPKD
jgi:tRNA(Ile)-lysidine synthase TilS/MesJ